MQIATVQKKKISNKQLKTVGLFVGIGVLIAASIGIFFMIQGNPTEASEEAPQNVSIQTIDPNNARVSWETGKDTIAVVEYGTTADATSFSEFAFSEVETTSHDVNLSSLEPNTTYFFQIRVGSEVYDNGGSYWTLTTPPEEEIDVSISPDPSVSTSPSPESSITPTATISATPTATISATIVPTPSIVASPSAVLTPTISGSPTPISTISATLTPQPGVTSAVCTSDNCTTILQSLGTSCTTQDYVRCLLGANVTTTPAATNTPTPTPLSSALKSQCKIDYLQSNSFSSWTWDDLATKEEECSTTFSRYFLQCKGTSWDSTDPAPWYCNETLTSSSMDLPCGTAPTPVPGQSVFCRVRAEADVGGSVNATEWTYGSTERPKISGDDANCGIDYVQGNTCYSWIWDYDYQKDPRCADKFDHYFLQCTDDGIFNSSSTWYCNITSEDHYLDLPCYNAVVPGDGMPITCRVRAEDGYGVDTHVTSWSSGTSICPTSTPTPTPSPTNTPTNTPTLTPVP
ncbi:hypothetical protein CO051_02720 [Candidatus Roizmanbacteria bacterium CG_4_9_14_0_2_um_filter_39_13]|uniref:Fibronectin type-III domain-containing protein n=1 Tax=Candidatus Roizmanbacteria bacterium CG_4_9_14_0_2_um_filter_39_13 TaxID=1974839 RepID=A0A2M8F086_9BACT|nr:MAG: hypothetical protein CO051_02720 [Candidatus Roizmanbacteria bacterium CG_4_9_14_0_2_um_filter_39_13]